MGGCHFYIFNSLSDGLVVALTESIMSAFLLYYGFLYNMFMGKVNYLRKRKMIVYFVKRLISLLPMYLFVHIIGSFCMDMILVQQ